MKLHIELIPLHAWESNLRTKIKQSEWSKIRKLALAHQNLHCHICDKQSTTLDAHEVWTFDEANQIQRLVEIIGVCKSCHNTIHFGRAQKIGFEKEAIEQFLLVNECELKDFEREMNKAKLRFIQLSQIKTWNLDITWLEQNLDFPLKNLVITN